MYTGFWIKSLTKKWAVQPAAVFLFFIFITTVLSGCASSDVSRTAASNVDLGVQNAKNLVGDTDGSMADSYQNTSQQTKGALLGGAAGAVVGGLTSSTVGVIPGAAVGAILGASYGAYIDTHTTLLDKLENRGVTVIVLGDQILMVLPSTRIFNAYTSNINPQAYSTLNLVAQYINRFTKMLVKISAYTDNTNNQAIDLALSQQQAETVAKFLLACNLDARVLYAMGYGGTHLVVRSKNWDSDNYRIEITLEKLYV